jgi:hypothetical protein
MLRIIGGIKSLNCYSTSVKDTISNRLVSIGFQNATKESFMRKDTVSKFFYRAKFDKVNVASYLLQNIPLSSKEKHLVFYNILECIDSHFLKKLMTMEEFQKFHTIYSWNILLQRLPYRKVNEYFLKELKIAPNAFHLSHTIKCILKADPKNSAGVDRAMKDFEEYGVKPNSIVLNVILKHYGTFMKREEIEAYIAKVIEKYDIKLNVASLNNLLGASLQTEKRYENMEPTLQLFKEYGVFPDASTLSIVIQILASKGKSSMINTYIKLFKTEYGVEPDAVVMNCAIVAYGKEKKIEMVKHIFKRLTSEYNLKPDVIILTSLLKAYFECGLQDQVETLLAEFREKYGIIPDEIARYCIESYTKEAKKEIEVKKPRERIDIEKYE